jgi:hypothetical protein
MTPNLTDARHARSIDPFHLLGEHGPTLISDLDYRGDASNDPERG